MHAVRIYGCFSVLWQQIMVTRARNLNVVWKETIKHAHIFCMKYYKNSTQIFSIICGRFSAVKIPNRLWRRRRWRWRRRRRQQQQQQQQQQQPVLNLKLNSKKYWPCDHQRTSPARQPIWKSIDLYSRIVKFTLTTNDTNNPRLLNC